jgi:trehalose-6-phosphate synthase
VWLDEADINGYYHGFANRALWPLCHMLIQHFEFRTEYWERYKTVNLRFAHAVADEAERCTGRSMAWIQDYHFALASEYLRAMQPSLFIHQFWHIPFPPADILRLLPAGTHQDVLRGLLGNDLVEFQIDRYAMNFLDCVDKYIPEARVDHVNLTVSFRDRIVRVGAFPISIDVERFERMARSADSEARIATLRQGHTAARSLRRPSGLHQGHSGASPRVGNVVDRVARAPRAVHVHIRMHAVAERVAGVQPARSGRDAVGHGDQ